VRVLGKKDFERGPIWCNVTTRLFHIATRLFQEIKLFSEILFFRHFSKTLAAKSLDVLGFLHINLGIDGGTKEDGEFELELKLNLRNCLSMAKNTLPYLVLRGKYFLRWWAWSPMAADLSQCMGDSTQCDHVCALLLCCKPNGRSNRTPDMPPLEVLDWTFWIILPC